MRHNTIKTFDGKTAATTDKIPAAVTRIGHSRPVDAGNLHLQIQTATEPDFSDAVTAIDTYANAGDRAKVLLFDGSGFVAIDEGGAGKSFGGQSVLADVASIEPLQYVRLRWFEVLEPMRYFAWDGRYFPASGGGGGGASSAAASTTGTLMVNITGDATGGWNIDGSSTWLASGAAISLAPGQYTVFFKLAANDRPNPKPATIYPGAVTEITGVYTEGPPDAGSLTVTITGPADARWSYNGGITWIVSGYNVLLNGTYTVTFKPVSGYDTPSNQTIYAEMGTNPSLTATYAEAGSGATGYSAYLLGTTGYPELISAAADPTKCVGGDQTFNIINGMLFWIRMRRGADSDWAACSGGGGSLLVGYGIKNAGTLHAIDQAGNVSQIGVATNWAAVSGMSGESSDGTYTAYALNTAGELYALQGTTAAKIGASTTWSAVSSFSLANNPYSVDVAAIAIGDGKLYRLDADTPTQIGVATNWAAVGPLLNGLGLAKNTAGELFAVTATRATTAVVQVGSATNWDKLSRVHATNTNGELYLVNGTTATRVGTATNWSALAGPASVTDSYALNTAGELYALQGTTATRVGTASDWAKLAGGRVPVAVRGTAL